MPRRRDIEAGKPIELKFPRAGMDRSRAFSFQPTRQGQDGYGNTTPLGINVQAYEALTERGRGGTRPGLVKYPLGQVPAGSVLIQELNTIVYTASAIAPTVPALAFRSVGLTKNPQSSPGAATVTAAFDGTVAAGNLLVIVAAHERNSVTADFQTPTDTLGTVYTRAAFLNGGATNDTQLQVWYGLAPSTGTNTATIARTNLTAPSTIACLAYNYVRSLGPLSGSGTNTITADAALTTGTITVTATGSLLIGAFSFDAGIASITEPAISQAFTPGTGFTTRVSTEGYINTTPPPLYQALWVEDKIVSANAAATATFGSSQSTLIAAGAAFIPWSATTQTNVMGRLVVLMAVAAGNVYVVQAGDAAWATGLNATGQTPPLNADNGEPVRSSQLGPYMYFADGENYVRYHIPSNVVSTWTASAGTLPVGFNSTRPRLICTWRGSIVLSGIREDPSNVYGSATGDGTDFDDEPVDPSPSQSWRLSNHPAGLVGDLVTSLCPYSDDTLIIFCDHSIWLMQGHPLAGGTLMRVSDSIGGTWGICWCKGPDGAVYFMSNQMAVMRMTPGQQPVPISGPVHQLLAELAGDKVIRLIWDIRFQGPRAIITSALSAAAETHYFYEQRSGAWWQVVHANNSHNAQCATIFDGNTSDDRLTLIGSWDGYVRAFSQDATTDDGTNIASEVWIGPLTGDRLDELLLRDFKALFGESSGTVTWGLYLGSTAEEAFSASAVMTGTLGAGRSLNYPVNRAGHAIWIKLTSSASWQMETIVARAESLGEIRRRGGV